MKTNLLVKIAFAATVGLLALGCSEDDDESDGTTALHASSCIGCHANQELLEATMAPDTTPEPENPGEG